MPRATTSSRRSPPSSCEGRSDATGTHRFDDLTVGDIVAERLVPAHPRLARALRRAHPGTSTRSTTATTSRTRSGCPACSRTACSPWASPSSRSSPGLGDPGRVVDYEVRFTRPVVVDPEIGADVSVVAKVGQLDDEARVARIDLTVKHRRGRRCSARRRCASRSPDRCATSTDPVLAQLTTLRTGGGPTRMIDDRDDPARPRRPRSARRGRTASRGSCSAAAPTCFVGDEPFDGTVVRVRDRGHRADAADARCGRRPARHPCACACRPGDDWDDLVAYAVEHGYSPASRRCRASPGRSAPRPVQNIGAYGQEIVQTLVEVELIDEATRRCLGRARRRARARLPHLGAQARTTASSPARRAVDPAR